jgi:hypothetical protein
MGWGDVRYCFVMAILVIKSPEQSLGDLLFLLRFLLLLDSIVTPVPFEPPKYGFDPLYPKSGKLGSTRKIYL